MALDPDEARGLLAARLQELKGEDALAAEATAPVTLEQDSVGRLSRVDALQQQAMALASQRRREAERNQIEAALRRIREGEYGYCITCGEEIGEARLRQNPAAPRCVGCAA
jgi:DnaK suppressor protein